MRKFFSQASRFPSLVHMENKKILVFRKSPKIRLFSSFFHSFPHVILKFSTKFSTPVENLVKSCSKAEFSLWRNFKKFRLHQEKFRLITHFQPNEENRGHLPKNPPLFTVFVEKIRLFHHLAQSKLFHSGFLSCPFCKQCLFERFCGEKKRRFGKIFPDFPKLFGRKFVASDAKKFSCHLHFFSFPHFPQPLLLLRHYIFILLFFSSWRQSAMSHTAPEFICKTLER